MATKITNIKSDPTSGMAITSLVIGILSLVLCWVPVLGLLLSIPALVFGILALVKISKTQGLGGNVISIIGIILGGLALIVSLLITIGSLAYFGALSPSTMIQNSCFIDNPVFTCSPGAVTSSGSSPTILSISVYNSDALEYPANGTFVSSTGVVCTSEFGGIGKKDIKFNCPTSLSGNTIRGEFTLDYPDNGFLKQLHGRLIIKN